MFDRVALTICAYLFGSLCARYLEPGTEVADATPAAQSVAQAELEHEPNLDDDATVASKRKALQRPAITEVAESPATTVDTVDGDTQTGATGNADADGVALIPAGNSTTDERATDVVIAESVSSPPQGRFAPLSDIVADIYEELAKNDAARELIETAKALDANATAAQDQNPEPETSSLAAKNHSAAVDDHQCPGAPAFDEPAASKPSGIYADQARPSARSQNDMAQELTTSSDDESADRATSTADAVVHPALSPKLLALERKVHLALNIYRRQNLNTRDHSAWSIMHSLIGYGVEKDIHIGGPSGKPVNAIGWICFNGLCRGERLFYMGDDLIVGRLGPGRQGHHGQFLSMLAQSRVRGDYPIRIGDKDLTVNDLVRSEMKTCRPKSELTFKLIGIAHYVDMDEKWTCNHGQDWTIERVVREELKQKITGAACGGTHRLFGLAYALNRRHRSGLPVDGDFKRTEKYLNDYHEYTFKLQNRDGSFSTAWFSGRGAKLDVARRLETTGHTAEWLSFSLPKDQLHRPQMVKAIDYLADLLIKGRHREWKIGPLGHGLHALNLYQQRAFQRSAEKPVEQLTNAK